MNAMFKTNQYRVLEILWEACKETEENCCKIKQGEIAEMLHLSRAAVNKIFSNLQTEGYISMITRGRWKISDNAIHLIQITQQL